MKKNRLIRQKGGAFPLAAAAIPFIKASLPILGKAALADGVGFGSSKLLGKIFGGSRSKTRSRRGRRRRYVL